MMHVSDKEVAVLVHDHFEQSEFEEPIRALEQAGAHITIISADALDITGMHHTEKGDTFQADLLLAEARSEDYDALIIPGGAINADNLRMAEKARGWVVEYLDSGKLVAAICHAPWLLVSADVVEERRLTSYFTIQDDIRNAGGEWVDLPVVVDDNLITSRKPDDLEQFNHAIITWLNKQPSIPGYQKNEMYE